MSKYRHLQPLCSVLPTSPCREKLQALKSSHERIIFLTTAHTLILHCPTNSRLLPLTWTGYWAQSLLIPCDQAHCNLHSLVCLLAASSCSRQGSKPGSEATPHILWSSQLSTVSSARCSLLVGLTICPPGALGTLRQHVVEMPLYCIAKGKEICQPGFPTENPGRGYLVGCCFELTSQSCLPHLEPEVKKDESGLGSVGACEARWECSYSARKAHDLASPQSRLLQLMVRGDIPWVFALHVTRRAFDVWWMFAQKRKVAKRCLY